LKSINNLSLVKTMNKFFVMKNIYNVKHMESLNNLSLVKTIIELSIINNIPPLSL